VTDGRRLRIGIDTGGTFTDVVAFDEVSGQLAVTKTPTTPADPAAGFMAGLAKVLALLGADGADVASVSHGTTIATNQLLEGRTGRLGFITTEGFEFMLEIARQSVPDGYGNSYFWVKPDRIVPPSLIKTVPGRLDHTGAELRPFGEAEATRVARWFRDQGVDAIGVCFLHSYASPVHEERMAAVLAREHPDAVVSISSQVVREYREYERAMTTLIDASVKPAVSRYLGTIGGKLAALTGVASAATAGRATIPDGAITPDGDAAGGGVPLLVMQSNGGVLAAGEAARQPVTTVLSGPAAGALGAATIARAAGVTKVLTCDGGGTSTDVAVVVDGQPAVTTEGRVGDFTSMMPMVDVVTVGAGGGSVAWVSPEGALKAGPRSAGADPGPVCYGNGGDEVTVTDAHLVLGRIPPHLLGGEVALDTGAAQAAVSRLAARLGLPAGDCATGILEVTAWNQANAVRQVTVKRGLDVREFTLVTFGGSGSLLLCPLMDILGVPSALVPRNPGNVSAFGLLTVDMRSDFVRTAVCRHDQLDPAALAGIFAGLERSARAALSRQGFAEGRQKLARSADLRYYGQAFEVPVPVPDGPVTAALAAEVAGSFHAAHHARYGYDFRGDPRQRVEWVSLRVTGVGPLRPPGLAALPPGDGGPERARTGTRPVCFGRDAGYQPAAVLRRDRLAAGDRISGPAVIEEYGATVPLHPGFTARVDRLGNLLVTPAEGGR
jgi:N-methylhydantoinase A